MKKQKQNKTKRENAGERVVAMRVPTLPASMEQPIVVPYVCL
jgi:hypothetical protein